MKNNNKIVLIQPATAFSVKISPFYEMFDSVGLLSLQQYLINNNYEVKYFHIPKLKKLNFDLDSIINLLKKEEPVVWGIGLMWLHQSAGAIEICRAIKSLSPNSKIIVGGQHASVFYKDIMENYHDIIDCIVLGEGELTLLEIAESINNTNEIKDGIEGTCRYVDNDLVVIERSENLNVNEIPMFSYDKIFPKSKLFNYDLKIPRTANLITIRGNCNYNCNYCLQAKEHYKLRRKNPQFYSVEYLLEQIKIFINQKKTRITIADSFLSNKPETISEFIRLAHKENIQLEQINFFAEPGYVNRHIFRELSRFPAKKIAIDYGIETGSQKVAMNMQRFSDYDTISKDIIELGKVGVSATAWWLFNLPGESLEDIKLTLDFMKFTINNNVYVERVSPLILFPNTNLYKNKEKYGIRTLMNNFDDFMIFSKIDRNESGIYPELITHESDLLNKKTILQVQQNIFNIVNDLQKGKPIQLSANNIF